MKVPKLLGWFLAGLSIVWLALPVAAQVAEEAQLRELKVQPGQSP